MAAELAERRGIPLAEARDLLTGIALSAPLPAQVGPVQSAEVAVDDETPQTTPADSEVDGAEAVAREEAAADEVDSDQDFEDESRSDMPVDDSDARVVLAGGIREIAGEVRNSLDFHRSQDGGGEVSNVVLSGPALEIAGFAAALEAELGFQVQRRTVDVASDGALAGLSADRLAIATGLAVQEVAQ
jgi:Tfp pilus assembly PilM family ATPase